MASGMYFDVDIIEIARKTRLEDGLEGGIWYMQRLVGFDIGST